MAARHAGQTGKREMLVSSDPQRRQSEGNKTVNKDCAAEVAKRRTKPLRVDLGVAEAIEVPACAA